MVVMTMTMRHASPACTHTNIDLEVKVGVGRHHDSSVHGCYERSVYRCHESADHTHTHTHTKKTETDAYDTILAAADMDCVGDGV